MSIHTRNEMEEEDRDDTATWTLSFVDFVHRSCCTKKQSFEKRNVYGENGPCPIE